MPFPTRPEALTPSFLTDVLGHEVTDVWVAPLGEPGRSCVASVAADLAGGGTLHLVAKVRRDGRPPDGMIRREVAFYRRVAGLLGASTPRARFAEIAPDGEFLLLLDHAAGGHPVDGLDLDGAMAVLRAVAAVHGRCWADPTVREALPVRVYAACEIGPLVASVRDGWDRVWARFPRHLPGLPDLADLTEVAAALRPATLTHNDLHAQNVLVGPAGVVFVDWQNASIGTPLFDVATLLAGCVRPDVQRAHGTVLLAAWEDALVEAGGARVPDLAAGYRAAVGLLFAYVTRYLASVSDEEAASRSMLLRHWDRVCAGLSTTR